MEEFKQIYAEHAAAVYRMSLRATGRKTLAGEITGEAFWALRQNWNTVDRQQLPDWLFTVAKCRAAAYWCREVREGRLAMNAGSAQQPDGAAHPLADLLRQCPDLGPLHRVCILLRFVHSLPKTEIARLTNMNERQVNGHSQYALYLLCERIVPVHHEQCHAAKEARTDA